MSVMISARERIPTSGFALTRLPGRARGMAGTTPPAGSPATGRGLIEKIGARCGLNGPRALAIDRQAHRHAGARSHAAAEVELSSVQLDQPFHDRQPESRSIVRTVVGGTHLEERIAHVAQIVFSDADAGIFHD